MLRGYAVAAGVWLLLPWCAFAQNSFTYGSTPWPEMPQPPRAQVQWVSDDMRINGVPMRIQTFQSQASQDEVVAFYKAHWQANTPGAQVAVTPAPPNVLVATPHGPFYLMARVKALAGGGAEGTLSISQVQGVHPRLDAAGIPAPPSGAQVVNVVESRDGAKQSKQVLWLTQGSTGAVSSQYHHRLQQTGWTLLQEQQAPVASKEASVVRMYAKGPQQLDVVVGLDAERGVTVMQTNLVTVKP